MNMVMNGVATVEGGMPDLASEYVDRDEVDKGSSAGYFLLGLGHRCPEDGDVEYSHHLRSQRQVVSIDDKRAWRR